MRARFRRLNKAVRDAGAGECRGMQGNVAVEELQAAAGAKCRHAQALPLKIASLCFVRESIDAFTALWGC